MNYNETKLKKQKTIMNNNISLKIFAICICVHNVCRGKYYTNSVRN